MEYLSWKFYDRLVTPTGMVLLKALLVISLIGGMLGVLTRYCALVSAAMVVLYQGILRSFGHFNHDEMLGIYCLAILAVTPCGDGFALAKARRPRAPTNESWVYGYPVLLMQVLVAWTYCTAGLLKLRLSGLEYFSPDNLPTIAVSHSLDNLHDTQFKLGFMLSQFRPLIPAMTAAAVAWEVLFPVCLVWRRAIPWFLGIGMAFHLSTMLVMNITFPTHLPLYLIFLNWPVVRTKAQRLIERTRVVPGPSKARS